MRSFTGEKDRSKELGFCTSFKTIMMLFVVLGHACIIYYSGSVVKTKI